MVKKTEQEIVDRRLEETLDLFQPTAQQGTVAEETESKPTPPKSRKYEAENPAFSFRIRPEDNDRIKEWADRLNWTRDDVARGLVGAALEAMEKGRLVLDADHEVSLTRDARGHRRRSVKTIVGWSWADEPN